MNLQLILLDLLLLSRIITENFVLRARNTDEYKKMQDKGGLICLVSMICIALAILKFAGFDFAALFSSDSSEPLSFDIISMLTGEMLIWVIPLTVGLFAVYFAVVYHHSRFARPGGMKMNKAKVRAKETKDLAASHCEPVGFLYKELRQNTKSICAVILLPLLILIFLTGVIAIASLNENNGGDGWIVKTLTSDMIRIASAALGYLSVSGLLMSVFHGDITTLLLGFFPALSVGAYILSYKISCNIFMKGVNEYDK